MIVETYEVTEATTEGRDRFEIDAEAQALIESLGLDGQSALLRGDDDTEVKTRIPYQQMTAEEVRVYETLYPEKVDVSAYSAGPIPLRVLQVVAHSRTIFDDLKVWGPKSFDPDPVLVGYAPDPANPHRQARYLLARWGDALEPFDELRERAVAVVTREWRTGAEALVRKAQAFLAYSDADVNAYIAGGWSADPWAR